LSLSKKFDNDNGSLNPILEQFFLDLYLMLNFPVQQQGGKKHIG
jgi:hypothetical protein